MTDTMPRPVGEEDEENTNVIRPSEEARGQRVMRA